MTVLALLGAKSLYIIFVWLGSAALAGWQAERKGYPERYGLATGLILFFVGPIVWLVIPAKKFDTPSAKE